MESLVCSGLSVNSTSVSGGTAAPHTINIDTTALSVSFHSIQIKGKVFSNKIFLKLKKMCFLSQPSESLKMLTYF